MFDDLKKTDNINNDNQNHKAPLHHTNNPQEVEDIFASTSKSPKVPLSTTSPLGANDSNSTPPASKNFPNRPITSPNAGLEGLQSSPQPIGIASKGSGSKKIFLKVLLFIIILGILGISGWLIYDAFFNKSTDQTKVINQVNDNDNKDDFAGQDNQDIIDDNFAGQDNQDNNNQKNTAPGPLVKPQDKPVLDTDNDGLSDKDESTWGTDKNKPDTDNDGLFDREEVMIYHTNPLIKDTDGDGYLDGEEVKNGYDPNGPGRLFSN